MQLREVIGHRDQLHKEKFDFCSIVDGKDDIIGQHEIDKLRMADELACRKEMIEAMGLSMLDHEKENRELAQKLSLMKQELMDNDTGIGMTRKFGCVQIGRF